MSSKYVEKGNTIMGKNKKLRKDTNVLAMAAIQTENSQEGIDLLEELVKKHRQSKGVTVIAI